MKYIILIAYLVVLLIVSLISMSLFKKDKKLATGIGPDRIKEKVLLESVVLGGAIGAFFGRRIYHHKTDKKYFSIVIYFSLLLQIITAVVLLVVAL